MEQSPLKLQAIWIRRASKNAWHSLLRNKVLSIATILIIALMLFVFNLVLALSYASDSVISNVGEKLDISVEIREGWRYLNNDYLKVDDIVGKGIWRPVSKGTTIKNYHIKQAENIQRGDTVMIIAEKGSLRIEAPGKVLETGKPGEMIRVINTLSGKEIFAKIIDAQTVSVPF